MKEEDAANIVQASYRRHFIERRFLLLREGRRVEGVTRGRLPFSSHMIKNALVA